MSADASVGFVWADGHQTFRLPLKQLFELQDKCDAGPGEILDRLNSNRWRINDVRETIRLGLIGGGMEPSRAYMLVARYVDNGAWLESRQAAQVILMSALAGVPEDPVGKPEEAPNGATDVSAEVSSTV